MKYVKHEPISLKNHPEYDEPWLERLIKNDPSILGLGDLTVVSTQRSQHKAGRLDMLLKDAEEGKRFEVELMLGAVDESHIIRCIEYWDNESRRYTQYDHTAVLIAEDVLSRFLGVIRIISAVVPIILIQLSASRVGENLVLQFNKVLEPSLPGSPEDEEVDNPPTDRAYWEKRASRQTMVIVDECLRSLQSMKSVIGLNYRKHYVGIADGNRSNNFVVFYPKKKFVKVAAKVVEFDHWKEVLEKEGLEVIDNRRRNGRLLVTLDQEDFAGHMNTISDFLKASFANNVD